MTADFGSYCMWCAFISR